MKSAFAASTNGIPVVRNQDVFVFWHWPPDEKGARSFLCYWYMPQSVDRLLDFHGFQLAFDTSVSSIHDHGLT